MLRTAAKLIMYHGTAAGSDGQILRRILKEGLVPDPPRRSFDVQRDKPTHERSLESLGGVYFSHDPWGVRKFSQLAKQKFGGDRVGVVAQIETRGPAITIDEDDLFPLSSRNKIADRFFRGVYRVVEASDYLLLSDMEAGKLDYGEMAEWFVDNVVAKQWDISSQEKQRIVPSIAMVAELQVLTQLASESERYAGQYWSIRHLYEQFGPKEAAAELFEQLKAATQRALAAVRRAANLPKEEWRQKLHKVRVTEPVGYGGANRIIAVFHWDDDYDRYKRDGYYLVGRVDFVAAGAQQYITQMIQFFAESSSQDMLWTDQKGKVLYDQRNPEIANQKAASVLRYRGAVHHTIQQPNVRMSIKRNHYLTQRRPDPRLSPNAKKWWYDWNISSVEPADAVVIAQNNENEIVGFVRLHIVPDRTGKTIYGVGTWVDPAYRGLGIGKKLWAHAIRVERPTEVDVVTSSRGGSRLMRSLESEFPGVEWSVNHDYKLYQGAVYREAATRPTDNSIWYHASDNILVEPMRPLYLSDSPLEYLGKHVYAFTIDPTAIWGDITHHHEYQNGIWMPLVHESMDSVGDNLGTVTKLAKAGFDVVWDRRDYAAGYAQIFVVNPNVLTEINSDY